MWEVEEQGEKKSKSKTMQLISRYEGQMPKANTYS